MSTTTGKTYDYSVQLIKYASPDDKNNGICSISQISLHSNLYAANWQAISLAQSAPWAAGSTENWKTDEETGIEDCYIADCYLSTSDIYFVTLRVVPVELEPAHGPVSNGGNTRSSHALEANSEITDREVDLETAMSTANANEADQVVENGNGKRARDSDSEGEEGFEDAKRQRTHISHI